jgi:hypothetical protein
MTIVDHRISAEQGPMIDMRSIGKPSPPAGANGRATDAGRTGAKPGIIEMLPGTSTEGAPPPLTAEEGELNKRPKNEPPNK